MVPTWILEIFNTLKVHAKFINLQMYIFKRNGPKFLFLLKSKIFLNEDVTDLEHLEEFGAYSKFTINIGDLTYGLEKDLFFDTYGTNNKCVRLRLHQTKIRFNFFFKKYIHL